MDGNIPELHGPASELASGRRRKLRKGAHSCWECKRRKQRCVFSSQGDSLCVNCRRRGWNCTSQDSPEVSASAHDGHRQFGDQIGRVHSLLNELASKLHAEPLNAARPREDGLPTASVVYPTPASITSESSPGFLGAPPPPQGNQGAVSKSLLSALPSPEDTDQLLRSVHRVTFYCHKIIAEHQDTLKKEDLDTTCTRKWFMPTSETHPVIIAKEMLFWVLFLQGPWYHRHLTFSEPPRRIMERLANAVMSLVTTNDELHGSLESLECIMLESLYHSHSGNLRRAWLGYRRAMLLAQLMGLDRSPKRSFKPLDSNAVFNPESMWCRIVYMDHYLSLLLGLPQGTNRDTMRILELALDNSQFPIQRLERSLTTVAGQILDRNSQGRYSYADDQAIDAELLAVSQSLPDAFWRLPKFDAMVQGSFEDIYELNRLSAQVYYFYLLNQLHLPYILSSVHNDGLTGEDRRKDYSAMTCATASREVLRRFTAYRSFNHEALCFRLVDFTALTAALTLLIIHLDSRLSSARDDPEGMVKRLLAHQRAGDRNILEEVLETLDLVSQYHVDAMSIESAKMLRLLLEVEEEAAQGKSYHWTATKTGENDGNFLGQRVDHKGGAALQVSVPSLGAILISPGSCISRVRPGDATGFRPEYEYLQAASTTTAVESPTAEHTAGCPDGATEHAEHRGISSSRTMCDSAASDRGPDDIFSSLTTGAAGGINDLALQGVDMAFFNNFLIDTSVTPIADSGGLRE